LHAVGHRYQLGLAWSDRVSQRINQIKRRTTLDEVSDMIRGGLSPAYAPHTYVDRLPGPDRGGDLRVCNALENDVQIGQ
jgi:hypothetical protein